jgi:hypothetical protein
MTDSLNFERTHPLYDEMLPVYRRNADLYTGGHTVERAFGASGHAAGPAPGSMPGHVANKYLTRHPLEKDEQYAIRVRRAAYRNYAAPIVDLFSSSVTDGVDRQGVARISRLDPLLRDCDRQGNTPERFFKDVITRAAAVGVEFVLIDMPEAAAPAFTEAEARLSGLLPYFVRIPAENIIAWDFAPDGSLDWAVQRETCLEAAGPFEAYQTIKVITLWRKDGWERYVSRGGGPFEPAGGGEHTLGRVPIVPFIYERESAMTGRGVTDDVASLIIRVFNQDSEMDKMLFDAAVPLLVAYGVDEEGEEVLQRASSSLWRFSGADTRLEYVETSGASYSAKRQQTLDDIDSIREISLRQTRPRGAQVESAEARRLDAVQISSQLADFARNAAASERLCWELAASYLGEPAASLAELEIKYNGCFDPESVREKLTESYLELRRNGDLSRETLWRQIGLNDEQIRLEKELLAAESTLQTLSADNAV